MIFPELLEKGFFRLRICERILVLVCANLANAIFFYAVKQD